MARKNSLSGKKETNIGILLSGVGPSMTLLSGAMLAFLDRKPDLDRAGIKIKVISTSGIGALIGLLYLAPKNCSPEEALSELPNLFITDALYNLVPFNFRLYTRNTPLGQQFWEFGQTLPRASVEPGKRRPLRRLFNDLVDLGIFAATPPQLDPRANGLLELAPFVEDWIDFDRAVELAGETKFYMNSFDLTSRQPKIFNNQTRDSLNYENFDGAQSFLVRQSPNRSGDAVLTSGLAHDPAAIAAIRNFHSDNEKLNYIVTLDPIPHAYRREPENLQDAFQLMLMNPIVTLQTQLLGVYAAGESKAKNLPPLYCIPLDDRDSPYHVGAGDYPNLLRWLHSSAVRFEDVGWYAANDFIDDLIEVETRSPAGQVPELTQRFEARYRHIQRAKLDEEGLQLIRRHVQPYHAMCAIQDSRQNLDQTAPYTGVVIGGGAPMLHLAAGALAALSDEKIPITTIGAAGAGALPGILFATTPGADRSRALERTLDINVHDLIYDAIPLNFKVFQKRGPLTEIMTKLSRKLHVRDQPNFYSDREFASRRLINDWIDLLATVATPSSLNYFSPSICQRLTDSLDGLVNWEALKTSEISFYLNAYNITKQHLEVFDNSNLDSEAFFAALALRWLYEPTEKNGSKYSEGAAHDPSGLNAFFHHVFGSATPSEKRVNKIIVINALTSSLRYKPDNIYSALQSGIMDPLVTISDATLGHYAKWESSQNEAQDVRKDKITIAPKLYRIKFDEHFSDPTKFYNWSYSNAESFWRIGYLEGRKLARLMNDVDQQEFESRCRYAKPAPGELQPAQNAFDAFCAPIL
jgi:NTE family protein